MSVDNWIRVDVELPPHMMAILLGWAGKNHVCEGRYNDGRLMRKPRQTWEAGMRKVHAPTHWQYLPEAPTDESNPDELALQQKGAQ